MEKVYERKKKLELLELLGLIHCERDIPSLSNIPELPGASIFLILDYLMLVTTRSYKNLNSLAMKICHCLNMSIMFVCEYVLYGDGKLRQVKSNRDGLL